MTLFETRPGSTDSDGVIGRRQLVCVQTIDIARLTHHPVPIIAGQFVAVGGRGPKGDSNESGKTSFLASVALLAGDAEWGLRGTGAAGAAQLLFEPRTAGAAAHRYTPAREGFVAGVFAEPENPAETALTVWLRIQAAAPYITARWGEGVHLASEPGDAGAIWASLGSKNEVGSRSYVDRLYGDVPRCLAYVSKRGGVRSGPSLLQMDAGAFTPAEIGEQLISLTGRGNLFTSERDARLGLHAEQTKLAAHQQADIDATRAEDEQLEGVQDRDAARRYLTAAEADWRLHFAAGLVTTTARHAELAEMLNERREDLAHRDQAVTQAEAELTALADAEALRKAAAAAAQAHQDQAGLLEEERQAEADARAVARQHQDALRQARDAAEGWDGRSVDRWRVDLDDAEADLESAVERVGQARRAVIDARAALDAALAGGGGDAGATLGILRNANIDASALADAVTVDDDAHPMWDTRLRLWTDAVAVATDDVDDAVAALAGTPGAVLVHGDPDAGAPLPDGIIDAPDTARSFLATIAASMTIDKQPLRAKDPRGVVVIGGWSEPQLGRSARVAVAEANLSAKERDLAAAEAQRDLAGTNVTGARAGLARAEAAESLPAIEDLVRKADKLVYDTSAAVTNRLPLVAAADEKKTRTAALVSQHDLQVEAAEARVETARIKRREAARAVTEAETQINSLALDYWENGWGGSIDAAKAALSDDPRNWRTLRNRAAAQLNDALSALHIRSGGEGAPTPQLADVARRRPALEEDPSSGRAATFNEIVEPLREWLDFHADRDQIIADQVARDRAQRRAVEELHSTECDRLEAVLRNLQDGIEARIEHALRQVSHAYDRLDRSAGGFGAELELRSRRPAGPTDSWIWDATPRWRRSRDGEHLAYTHQANTAQEKQQTVHLVLAALLSAPNPRGRILILDELGDSLGVRHRREVLEAIGACANEQGITVLGTCQDSVLADAAQFCRELIYFEYASKLDVLNHPARAFGFDGNQQRVRLTTDDVLADRPLQ